MQSINGMYYTARKVRGEYRGFYGVKGVWERMCPIRRLDRFPAICDARFECLDILAMSRYGGHPIENMGHAIA